MSLTSLMADEYDFDSSDEEDVRNTVGNIPIQWYDSLAHVGYDTSGRPIMRPGFKTNLNDDIDEFLKNVSTNVSDSALDWRAIRDPYTGQLVVLDDSDLDIVTKMASFKGVVTDGSLTPYEPWNDWFTRDVMQTPVTAHPPQKRSFVPSKLDRRRIGRMVYALKSGWLKPRLPSWAFTDPTDLDALRRYAALQSSSNLHWLDSDDEQNTLDIPSSSTLSYVFPDVWADQDIDASVSQDDGSWRSRFPVLLQNYRPPRPRPYQKAPQEPLPGHIASYNPPPEFILSKEEHKRVMKAWRERLEDGHVSRIPPQMPRKFDCLRHVPFSEHYLHEREERVKDLIMAARVQKQRLATTPDDLLPQIPSLSQLRPYPNHDGLVYLGHTGRITGLSLSACGQWLASISPEDGCLRIWETSSNYCFRCYSLVPPIADRQAGQIRQAANTDDPDDTCTAERPTATVIWNPKPELHLIAAAIGHTIFLINPALGDRVRVEQTDRDLQQWWKSRDTLQSETESAIKDDGNVPSKVARLDDVASDVPLVNAAEWSMQKPPDCQSGTVRSKTRELNRVTVSLEQPIYSLDWHLKGDYLVSVTRPILSDTAHSRCVKRLLLHRLSKMSSQSPFTSSSRLTNWRQAVFHPTGKPQLFVSSSRSVRIYDLVQQCELRHLRLDISSDHLSCISLHYSGEHLVAGTFDGRFTWFDIDLGSVPFKKMKLNHGAVRQLDCHRVRPLIAAALSDATVLILHATVSDDLLTKPIIIPVQLIRTGQTVSAASVLSVAFHPLQPYVYSGGADGVVRQFVPWR
ncbi:unnamed protein product [Dicrocoelium dendriticum]|nr:unnamed protein product [Dicrocoelium dendriticum]